MSCLFCGRQGSRYALTVASADDAAPSWRRLIEPVCPRCQTLLALAGDAGRVLKSTGERWWLGHTAGLFPAPGDAA